MSLWFESRWVRFLFFFVQGWTHSASSLFYLPPPFRQLTRGIGENHNVYVLPHCHAASFDSAFLCGAGCEAGGILAVGRGEVLGCVGLGGVGAVVDASGGWLGGRLVDYGFGVIEG